MVTPRMCTPRRFCTALLMAVQGRSHVRKGLNIVRVPYGQVRKICEHCTNRPEQRPNTARTIPRDRRTDTVWKGPNNGRAPYTVRTLTTSEHFTDNRRTTRQHHTSTVRAEQYTQTRTRATWNAPVRAKSRGLLMGKGFAPGLVPRCSQLKGG